jgi:hypothetical protein
VEEGTDQGGGGSYIYAVREEEAYLQTDEDEKEVAREPPPDPAWFRCWFCRKRDGEVQMLHRAPFPVRNPDTLAIITLIFICNECVAKFAGWFAQERPAPPA